MERPTVQEFKDYFYRDFPFATDQSDLTKVIDNDITKALDEAAFYVNETLFDTEAEYKIGFNYLTAHYLATDLMNAKQGIAGQYEWLATSKSVGSISIGVQIPEFIMKNPTLAMISKTVYGAKYLSLIIPSLIGGVFTVRGKTLA